MWVVKRSGHTEVFDERKVYASIYGACMNAKLGEEKSEQMADEICAHVRDWMRGQKQANSEQILEVIAKQIALKNKQAAETYRKYLDR